MKRRVLAILCVLSILMGMVVMPAAAETTAAAQSNAADTYQVGYAVKNFNPWVASDFDVATDVGTAEFLDDPENTKDKKIYPSLFSQSGNVNEWESVVTDLYDDNGDGTVDHNDGIFATCTAVTYGEKTVLFITTDTMKAWTNLVTAVRDKIVASEWGQKLGITADEIMVCSNHTHSGPQLDGSFNSYIDTSVFDTDAKQTALKTDRESYYNWVVDRIVAAAEESVADQSAATMSKGAVDATVATAAKGYNNSQGYHMNTIRHYERTHTADVLFWSGEVSSIYANTATPSHDQLVDQLDEYNHDAKDVFKYSSDYTTSWSTIDEADNTMYVLRFEFADSSKKPVVFVNWRAHSTMNSGVSYHHLSGDYAVALRQVLGENNYRAAFFNGAAGNVVPHATSNVYTQNGKLVKDKMDWLYEATDKNDSSLTLDASGKTYIYGKMLAEIAQYCMENGNSYMTDTPVGEIRTLQTTWKADKQKYSDELLEAAIALRGEVMSAKGWDLATFNSKYRQEFQENASSYFPYYYKSNGSTVAIINSRLHFNTVYPQAQTVKDNNKAVADYTAAIELDAVMLGEKVAFITSPNELADYYHDFTGDIVSHTAADKEAHNDWAKLNDSSYGTPFVLGYANQNSGYIAGWLDHKANTQDYATITGYGAEGYMLYSPGTYESMTSDFAAGQGEALIDLYYKMLKVISSDAMSYKCQHCGEVVEWKPLFAGDANSDFTSGHYVLVEDLYGIGQEGQQALGTSDGKTTVNVCLDLNGYTYSSESRCAIVYAGSTLNIMNMPGVDADGKAVDGKEGGTAGKMIGMTNSNNPGGGAFSVSAGATVNLYGGTLSFVKRDISVYGGTWGNGLGGVFYCSGTLNVYGGTIEGAEMQNEYRYRDNYIGAGGAVWLNAGAKLNMYGGRITSGSVPTGGAGPCVYLVGSNSKVTLSGDASIEDIYYRYSSDAAVTVSGTYTGTANLTFNDSSDTTFTDSITLAQNLDVGDLASGADISGATLSCSNTRADGTRWQVRASGSNLLLYGYEDATQAVIVNGNAETEYTSLADAISSYTSDGSNYIKLIKAPTDTAVTVSKETYLDLNGCNVNAAITATAAPLYVMDSMTNDYNVNDGYGYGKLTGALSGTVEGVPVESDVAVDGYLKVTESSDVSFHRVNLQIYATNIRAQSTDGTSYDPGMYYSIKEGFSADSVVANLINNSSNSDYYGIAMLADDGDSSNGKEIPSAATLKDDNHSKYYSFKAGNAQNAANGTLLSGILKETNNVLINRRNANITVYGSAYIKIGDQYMFGPCVEQSLRNLFVGTTVVVGSVELPQTPINNRTFLDSLNDTQWECLLGLYEKYQSMIDAWITDAGQENAFQAILNDAEYNALKILVVGNSHGLDATNLLYEVFEDQKQDGKYVTADGREYSEVVIGNLYHSGANMNQHYSWIDGDIEYSYDKIGTGDTTGEKWQHTVKDNCMDDALADEEWDIVVMQQMNHRSGIIGGDYTSVDDSNFNQANYQAVAKHIKEMCPDAKLAWHMVWTNPDEADFFSNESSTLAHPSVQDGTSTDWITNHNDWYGTDGSYVQSNLYAGIVNALKTKILNEDWLGYHIDYVLPSAVAVEYAQDILGCSDYVLYRDYTHMNNYGRLMVAYTWWAELMGYDSIGVDIIGEIPSTLDHGQSGKNENLTKNNAGNFVVTDDLKRIITRSVNYALDMNDSSLDNAYEIVEDNTISILGIGNSYTIDSMWMLGEVYQAENPGKTVQLGIAYKSGESLAGHVTNITGNSAVYDYLYWDSTSDKWTVSSEKMTLQQIIKAQKWEMVSMQQGSSGSGRPTTYNADIQTIQSYVETQLNYVPTYLWNMTWAYPEEDIATDNYTLETAPNASSFINYYGSSQATMYKAIMSTVQEKILPNATFEYLMPVGTAIQNANGTLTDHDLYRDYTHLSDLSRLMAAYTWYCELETVTLDEIQLTALPTVNLSSGSWYNGAARDLSDQELSLVINSVKDARTNNFETTDTSVYES